MLLFGVCFVLYKFSGPFGLHENAECRSTKSRSVENAECRKCGIVENAEC